ncbi:MAG: T9SS type A sorting domain-containing protein [Bacteroidetes bacterium]|nr:MAG: T9SS type A sorting domain-containing protein [Bacteroidota bacterium]
MRTLIVIASFLLAGSTQAQISFFKTFSNDSFDRGEGVVQLKDSSYLITGSSSSFSNSQQAFIMHIDSAGNYLWSRSYGGEETERGRRIFHVENDGIYVLGQTSSASGKFFDLYFLKTDLEGNILFEKNFGGAEYEDIHDAIMLKDTSMIIVGESYSNTGKQQNAWGMRLSNEGEVLWEQQWGGNRKDLASSVKALNDTIVYICGYQYNQDSLSRKGFLSRMNIDGTLEWTRFYGEQKEHALRDLHIFRDTIRGVGHFIAEGTSVRNFHRIMFDLSGNIIRDRYEFHGGDYDVLSIQRYGSNLYFLSKQVTQEPDIPTYPDGSDNLLYAYDHMLFYKGLALNKSLNGDDQFNQLIRTSDQGILAVGFNSMDDHVKVTVLKLDARDPISNASLTNGSGELVELNELSSSDRVRIYPNPSSGMIHVDSEMKIREFRLYSTQQQLLRIERGMLTNLSLVDLSPGVYFLHLYTDDGQQFVYQLHRK